MSQQKNRQSANSIKSNNHSGDIKNPNKGTSGTNLTYDKNQGNRGWQKNPQNPANSGKRNK